MFPFCKQRVFPPSKELIEDNLFTKILPVATPFQNKANFLCDKLSSFYSGLNLFVVVTDKKIRSQVDYASKKGVRSITGFLKCFK
jgi:hypothetical protein